jgi:NAD(P)-dependent dehydrogenase (short-subunit alcohol dehydrogenase family)
VAPGRERGRGARARVGGGCRGRDLDFDFGINIRGAFAVSSANATSRLALVTGASSGLGRALALEFAAGGRDVILLARDGARLAEVAREVEALGARAIVALADVRDESALRDALLPALGGRSAKGVPLDRVVHAAGVLALGGVGDLRSDDFRRCLEVNVLGSAHVARVTLPHLERSGGSLAFVSSIAGVMALPGGFTAYSASKWGVRGFADVLRPEAAALGVHVMTARPSLLATPMLAPLGQEAPAVYRAFTWHSPEKAARRIVLDLERRRRESYLSLTERLGAWCADAFPAMFTAGLHAFIAWKGRERGGSGR